MKFSSNFPALTVKDELKFLEKTLKYPPISEKLFEKGNLLLNSESFILMSALE